jgi:hypothetical protein
MKMGEKLALFSGRVWPGRESTTYIPREDGRRVVCDDSRLARDEYVVAQS